MLLRAYLRVVTNELVQRLGSFAETALYAAGEEVATELFEQGVRLSSEQLSELLEGSVEVDREERTVRIRIRHSRISEAFDEQTRHLLCRTFFAGVFGGLASKEFSTPMRAREVSCRFLGAPYCLYIVEPRPPLEIPTAGYAVPPRTARIPAERARVLVEAAPIIRALIQQPLRIEELERRTGVSREELATQLTLLAEVGLVRTDDRGRYLLNADSVLVELPGAERLAQPAEDPEALFRLLGYYLPFDYVMPTIRIFTRIGADGNASFLTYFEVMNVKEEPIEHLPLELGTTTFFGAPEYTGLSAVDDFGLIKLAVTDAYRGTAVARLSVPIQIGEVRRINVRFQRPKALAWTLRRDRATFMYQVRVPTACEAFTVQITIDSSLNVEKITVHRLVREGGEKQAVTELTPRRVGRDLVAMHTVSNPVPGLIYEYTVTVKGSIESSG